MASDIWKIGQEQTALDMFNDVKENGINGYRFLKGEKNAVKQLTLACAQMIVAYNEVINDQNDYMIEIDDINQKINNINSEYEEKIEALKKEIDELKQKEYDGTLTDEEKEQLYAKCNELNELVNFYNTSSNSEIEELNKKNQQRKANYLKKEGIATDYGETTVEKGTPLANTEVKGGFFRKLFGTTGKDKKEAGEKAVKIGNELLDIVNDGKVNETKITTKLKK